MSKPDRATVRRLCLLARQLSELGVRAVVSVGDGTPRVTVWGEEERREVVPGSPEVRLEVRRDGGGGAEW